MQKQKNIQDLVTDAMGEDPDAAMDAISKLSDIAKKEEACESPPAATALLGLSRHAQFKEIREDALTAVTRHASKSYWEQNLHLFPDPISKEIIGRRLSMPA